MAGSPENSQTFDAWQRVQNSQSRESERPRGGAIAGRSGWLASSRAAKPRDCHAAGLAGLLPHLSTGDSGGPPPGGRVMGGDGDPGIKRRLARGRAACARAAASPQPSLTGRRSSEARARQPGALRWGPKTGGEHRCQRGVRSQMGQVLLSSHLAYLQ